VSRVRFDAGRPCLNLLATIGQRGVAPVERLPAPADFAAWLVAAGLVDGPAPVSEGDLEQMRRLRDAIGTVVDATRRHRAPAAEAIALVNAHAAHPTPRPALAADGRTATRHSDRPVQAALAMLAHDAIALVTGPDLARVRECAAPECRMLFLDTSRGARRRWCSMTRCGNRAKARAHAARTRRLTTPRPFLP
jgi:predicted RNA-binding Zn ribbon-like protein